MSAASFALLIRAAAAQYPGRAALALPARNGDAPGAHVTYAALWNAIAHHAEALRERGVRPGDRVLVLVPLSADLYAAVLAVMALGAVAVLAPAREGRRAFAQVVRMATPRAVIETRKTRWLRWAVPALWRLPIRYRLTPPAGPAAPFEPVTLSADAGALLTFTSGTTGRPKGADRTHGTLAAQHRALAAAHPAPPGTAALTCFPVAVLHHLCCGHTAYLPTLDLGDVTRIRPDHLLAQIQRHGIEVLTGPPPVLAALADHVLARGASAPLRQIGVGGAPVPRRLLVALRHAFPDADVQVLYGSTEAEPVAAISADDVLAADPDSRLGYPAGYVNALADLRLLRLCDAPVRLQPGQRLDDLAVSEGGWGEVVVAGPHVVARYVGDPEAEARHKLRGEDGRIWHRMGDVACRDAAGRLWLGGRIGRMLPGASGPVAPFPLEMQMESLPGVTRAVLHAWRGHITAWIDGTPTADARHPICAILAAAGVADAQIVSGIRLPVDARHRWKVDYPALDRMAARRFSP